MQNEAFFLTYHFYDDLKYLLNNQILIQVQFCYFSGTTFQQIPQSKA